jgi:hypothetical protein
MLAHERAAQIWPLLTYAASHRQSLTYTILAKHIGVDLRGIGKLLEPIQSYCLIHELPALTSIAVNKNGHPGTGFIAAEDVPAEQQRVFNHDWLEHDSPAADVLRQAAIDRPSNGIPDAVTT